MVSQYMCVLACIDRVDRLVQSRVWDAKSSRHIDSCVTRVRGVIATHQRRVMPRTFDGHAAVVIRAQVAQS
ncbi:MAG: hypothetical protein DWH97_05785 [Planctomycetota bacterium]|nr:MAG: hypothetical protein DWH97_05785 [Planctomycetota bacterium]RLS95328.1 MAG: hypothetical protein DWI12_04540 [Planctomycetota bacterium]